MTHPRDYKQYKRRRRYPRVRRDALLDGHESVNNRLRARIIALTTANAQLAQLTEQRRLDLVAMRGHG